MALVEPSNFQATVTKPVTKPAGNPAAKGETKPAAKGEPRYSSHMWLTPANALTFVRMASTPLILVLIARRKFDFLTFALWFLLCVTDWMDGLLARRYGVSKSGAFLDPLADKLLVLGAMIMLVVKHDLWWLPVALMAFREVAMSIYRSVVSRQGISIPASHPAKYKTLAQQCCVGFAIAPWIGVHWHWIAQILLWVSVALTLYTGGQYFFEGRRRALSARAVAAAAAAAGAHEPSYEGP